MTNRPAAAWVPFTKHRTFDDAAQLAIEWAGNAATDGPVVMVADRIGEYHGRPLFSRFQPDLHISPKSRRPSVRAGAVLAHVPTPQTLDLAMQVAGDSAVVVTEHPDPWRLFGWAEALSAVDLLTGESRTLAPELQEYLRTLEFYGNNGYPGGYGRDHALRILEEMNAAELLDRDRVLSALLAGGVLSVAAIETLDKLIDKVAGPRGHAFDHDS